MDGEVTRESVEVPVACNWAALTADQQERQRALYRQLRADVKEVRELDDGYAFGHSPGRTVLLAIAEFVANERLCCPFFEFGLTVERDGGPVWLRMTGGGRPSASWRRRWVSTLLASGYPLGGAIITTTATHENAVDESRLINEVSRALAGAGDRERKAAAIAGAIRQAGGYRWVGLYEVAEGEIVNLAFDGPGAPAHPRFPVTEGLSGAAVASGETVVVGDVSEDPRYLTAFGSTCSEIVVPVVDRAGQKVVGTIDVESEEEDAFSEADRCALERCAAAVVALFEE